MNSHIHAPPPAIGHRKGNVHDFCHTRI
jgi:hypothetical protein